MEIFLESKNDNGLSVEEIKVAVAKSIEGGMYNGKKLNKVLIVPPDFTRFHSNSGLITNIYYHLLKDICEVDILPALGTHFPMTKEECEKMFGDIPFEKFIVHNWKTDVTKIGEVPGSYLQEITEGLWTDPIDVEVNNLVMDESYDLILSVGQVVPHEVIGMANQSKNIFVGVGGKDMINKSHMVGAVYGMERMMGKDFTPVRLVFDYGMKHFLHNRPILYVLTVTTAPGGNIRQHGLFISENRVGLEKAIALAQEKNIDFVDKPIKKCVVYLDPSEFRSTWLGNKSVYRTRMAIADGGELIVLAPGVHQFGEDPGNDKIIRKYGYCGRLKTLELFQKEKDLQENMGTAAHLIHGSSDGRFEVTYAVKNISEEEIASVHFKSASYDEMIKRYNPDKLEYGWNTMDDGEEIYYIPNPALGLWIDKGRFNS
ncbi:MAG: DUF2088 domain-containing protein [Treponema sp.]|nr:DUF2088 domain-containing protein [Treponema sp.]